MQYNYMPHGVCAKKISVDITPEGIIQEVAFEGGCNGNLKAIAKLVKNREIAEVVSILQGNTCGKRPTSCADQLCCALLEAETHFEVDQ